VLVLRVPALPEGQGQGIAGYCAFRVVADEMEVLGLAVAPSSRRLGLGRWLVGLALSMGGRVGAKTAFLEVRPSNEPALALYRTLGLRETGRRKAYYDEPVEDALVLARSLP
jgi:ribosomal-protein-alanine N-acetyltransferase